MERRRPAAPRALSVVLLAALLAPPACWTPERRAESEEERQLTMEMFRELMEQGTLRPVDSMEDAFAGIEPGMGPTPEDVGRPAAAGPGGEGLAEEEGPPEQKPPRNPYVEFGRRIKVHETGLITKPYPIRKGGAQNVLDLLQKYGDFTFYDPEQGPQGAATVRVEVLAAFDGEVLSNDIRKMAPPDEGKPVALGDWLVVTASPELLAEVEYFIDTFFASPPQIEIEAKIVEWVTRDSFDMGVGPIDPDTPIAAFQDKNFVKSLSYAFPNTVGGGEFLAQVGTVHDGVTYSALIEVLATFENISIISRPKVVVREGAKANIESTEKIPYLQISGVNPSGGFNANIAFETVGVRLFVVPRLIGTSTVELEIDVEASQQTSSDIVATTGTGEVIRTPTLATRTAKTVVYLKPGQAVILGGLITERKVQDERKIPLLGDLPIFGGLFRSTLTATEQAQVLFFIRPRVLEGIDLHREF